MKKITCVFNGLMGDAEQVFSGKTWAEVMNDFERFQDLECLSQQARMMGTPEDAAALDALEDCIGKCWNGTATKEDLKSFRCVLSIGGFYCATCEDETGTIAFDAPR